MKKYKGFTLIELIAVITLLALIVLVTVPVIINTLSKAEQKEYEDFKKLVANAAELYVERNRESYPDLNEIGGEVGINAEALVSEGYIKSDLENPINDKSIADYKIIVSVNQDGVFDYEIYERNTLLDLLPISKDYTLNDINKCSINGKCNIGTPLKIKVNDTKIYDFYVTSDDGNKVTLIMDRNLGNNVEWINETDYIAENNKETTPFVCEYKSCNDKGPITALNYLNKETSNWTNIPAIQNYRYDNNLKGTRYSYGYQKLEIINGTGTLMSKNGSTIPLIGIMRARFLTREEVNDVKTKYSNTMPNWLYANLYNTGSNKDSAGNTRVGHWTLTARFNSAYSVIDVHMEGTTSGDSSYGKSFGVRPVIEISRH